MATEEDRIDTGVLLTIGAVLTIAVIGVALAVTALVRSESDQLTAEKGATANLSPIQELRKEQSQTLAGTLDKARQAVLQDIQQDPNKATDPAPEDAGKKTEAPDAGAADVTDAGEDSEASTEGETPPEEPKDEPTDEPTPPEGAPKPKPPPAPPTEPEPEPEPEGQP